MDPRRSERLSEALREELEELINYELTDPRIDVMGVAEVLITPDGKHARVRSEPQRRPRLAGAEPGSTGAC